MGGLIFLSTTVGADNQDEDTLTSNASGDTTSQSITPGNSDGNGLQQGGTEEDTENTSAIGGKSDGETEAEASEATEESTAETTTETLATDPVVDDPAPGGFLDGFSWLYLVLALVVGIVLFLTADAVRRAKRKNKRRKRKEAAAAAAAAPAAPQAAKSENTSSTVAEAIPMAVPVAIQGGVAADSFQNLGAREDQQDSFGMTEPALYHQQGMLAVVADGMGGLANGKAVSDALVHCFVDNYAGVSGSRPQDVLLWLAVNANNQVNQMLRGAERSGSTLLATMIKDGFLHFLTVGDSRIYLYRGGALMQLNREHIYQEELAVKAVNRAVPLQQVSGDRQAHALTSYFGIGQIPAIDRNDEGIKLLEGDRILLMSDGVFGTLSREQMEQALQLPLSEAAKTMGEMVCQANKPYQDNNTAIILEYLG